MFRTAWFFESVLSEIVVSFSVRTRLPFFKSRPSKLHILMSIVAILLAIAITNSNLGNVLFEFVKMPAIILAWIVLILILYFISAEILKIYFFKKFEI